jgi:hypothetical protein
VPAKFAQKTYKPIIGMARTVPGKLTYHVHHEFHDWRVVEIAVGLRHLHLHADVDEV